VYEVYATRWDDAHVVEELIPARGLEFTLPLSDHGECAFSATVEPGRSFWRPAMSVSVSGVLVCRDSVPIWSGRLLPERQTGPRTFEFRAAEWGSAFEDVPAVPLALTATNDHTLFRRLISDAQAIAGQNYLIQMGATTGAAASDLTINAWDTTTVEEEFRRLGERSDVEWYVAATGTFENPTRTLVLGDRLGSPTPSAVLEYVESTEDYAPPSAPPTLTTLGNLFPTDSRPLDAGGRRGGNVISHPARFQSPGITATIAVGSGQELAQLRRSAEAPDLLTAGFPRRTRTASYSDVSIAATLQQHANTDLAAARGMVTSYTLSTFESDPEWTGIARGDTVRVELDTDVYAGVRPLVFEARVLDMAVSVPDDAPPMVNYTIADVVGV
jgi:hypothetical protein